MMTCPEMIGMDIARRHLLQGNGIGEHGLGLTVFVSGCIDIISLKSAITFYLVYELIRIGHKGTKKKPSDKIGRQLF